MYFLRQLQTTLTIKARALEEEFSDHLTARIKDAVVLTAPFPHTIIDDLLPPTQYRDCVDAFQAIKNRGFSTTRSSTQFAPFLDVSQPYDGYVYSLKYEDSASFHFLYSYTWNLYFRTLFRIPTNPAVSIALHFHEPGDRSGWVHHDYVLRSFHPQAHTPQGVFTQVSEKAVPGTFPLRRAIAFLYYLDNDESGAGGGTSLFRSYSDTSPITVAPKNNRLLAFPVTPHSLHAFEQSHTNRSSIVMWLFTNPDVGNRMFGKEANV